MAKRILAIGGGCALLILVAAACGGGAAPNAGGAASPPSEAELIAGLQKLDYPATLVHGTTLGEAGAPITILAFEDFTCPHCLEFTATTEQGIIDTFVKSGKVKFEFHYYPLRQSSVAPMVAAVCADNQGKFWDYRRRLFIEQAKANTVPANRYAATMDAAFGQTALEQYAADLALDAAKFAACLQSQAPIDTIQADTKLGDSLGLTGTPWFVVNGKALGSSAPASLDGWKQLIAAVK